MIERSWLKSEGLDGEKLSTEASSCTNTKKYKTTDFLCNLENVSCHARSSGSANMQL